MFVYVFCGVYVGHHRFTGILDDSLHDFWTRVNRRLIATPVAVKLREVGMEVEVEVEVEVGMEVEVVVEVEGGGGGGDRGGG